MTKKSVVDPRSGTKSSQEADETRPRGKRVGISVLPSFYLVQLLDRIEGRESSFSLHVQVFSLPLFQGERGGRI